jgi:hypothetical protein
MNGGVFMADAHSGGDTGFGSLSLMGLPHAFDLSHAGQPAPPEGTGLSPSQQSSEQEPAPGFLHSISRGGGTGIFSFACCSSWPLVACVELVESSEQAAKDEAAMRMPRTAMSFMIGLSHAGSNGLLSEPWPSLAPPLPWQGILSSSEITA